MRKSHLVLGIAVAALLVLGGLTMSDPVAALNVAAYVDAADVEHDIAYGSGARNRLDVYRPHDANGKSPVVVFFYGGNWVSGNRTMYNFVGRALAARGIVTIIPDYRLYPAVSYPSFLDDCAKALAWSMRHAAEYGGNPQRLFVMGHSAGAYNAAMLALDGQYLAREGLSNTAIRGLIGIAGPYEFLPVTNATTRPVFHYPNTPLESQPVHHVSKASLPALLMAPANDLLVNPKRNSGGLARTLRAAGVAATDEYFDGVDHTTIVASLGAPLHALAPTLAHVEQFIQSH